MNTAGLSCCTGKLESASSTPQETVCIIKTGAR
jgi:hypothetical protein